MLQAKIYMDYCEYNFENGCGIKNYSHGLIDTLEAKDAYDLIKKITCSYGTPCVFENRLIVQRTENADNHEPSIRELASWKEGKTELYLATYNIYVSEVKRIEDKLYWIFPGLEIL